MDGFAGLYLASQSLSAFETAKILESGAAPDLEASAFAQRPSQPKGNYTLARVAEQGWDPPKGSNNDGKQIKVKGRGIVSVNQILIIS